MDQYIIDISDNSTISELMVEIPGGEIELRDDRKKQKWTVAQTHFRKKNPNPRIADDANRIRPRRFRLLNKNYHK